MKRILSVCLSVLFLLTMLPLGAVAFDFNDSTMDWGDDYNQSKDDVPIRIYATPSQSTVCPGQYVDVTVSIADNPGLTFWNVRVWFDESAFELVSFKNGNVFPANGTSYGPMKSPASVTFADFINPDVIGDGILYTITLRVQDDAAWGTYDFIVGTKDNDLDNFSDLAGNEFDVNFQNNSITVEHEYDGACDTECNGCGAGRETGAFHQYDSDYDNDCNICGAANPDLRYCGDSNNDGKVNVRDLGLCQQWINGWDVSINMESAEVNGDGKINVRDLGLCQQWMNDWGVELKPTTPPEEEMQGDISGGDGDNCIEIYAMTNKAVVCPGEEIVVTVSIANNPGLVGWNVGAIFDESVFEVQSITKGNVFSEYSMSYGAKKSPAFATFADFLSSDITGDGSMYTVTLKVKDDTASGTYDIRLGTRNNDFDNFVNDRWDTFRVTLQGTTIVAGHQFDSACDTECNGCGEVRTATAAHTYDTACDTTCDECGALRTPPHAYSNNCDRDCNLCGTTRVAPHRVLYPCATQCERCSSMVTPTAEHTYSYACDAYCDICGVYRANTVHTYSDSCDIDCNVCGQLRLSPPHDYDNACDAVCNNCGEMQAVYGHAYDGDHDPTCNHCGAIREIAVVPEDAPAFVVDNVRACYGSTFTVAIRTRNNPGVAAYRLNLHYDHALLELVAAEAGDFTDISFGPTDADFFTMTWCDMLRPDNTTDGVVAWLTFRVKEGVDPTETALSLSYDADDVYNTAWDNVGFYAVAGKAQLAVVELGDANGDGKVNIRDLGLIQQYLNHWSVDILLDACDVNGDSKINVRDLGLFQQYLNGWDIEWGG